jgi:hypothetical protein
MFVWDLICNLMFLVIIGDLVFTLKRPKSYEKYKPIFSFTVGGYFVLRFFEMLFTQQYVWAVLYIVIGVAQIYLGMKTKQDYQKVG